MKMVPLGDIVKDVRSGFASGESDDNGVIQIRMNNITTDGHLVFDKIRKVPCPRNINELLVEPGDIVFNATNSADLVGKSALFSGYNSPVTYSNHFIRLKINHNYALPEFIVRFFHSQWKDRVFENMCKRWVNQATVSRDDLLALIVPLPPLPEQKRIAAILDQADNLRRLRQRAIDRLNQLGQAIFYEMFGEWGQSKKLPLVALGPKIDFLTSGSRGWAKYYSDSGSLFIRIQNIGYDEIKLEDVTYVSPPNTAEAIRTRVKPGDVLLSITADLGRTAVVPFDIGDAYINQHLSILRTSYFEPRYLSAALASPSGQTIINQKNKSCVKSGLNFEDIKSIEVPDASRTQQNIFVRRVNKINFIKKDYYLSLEKSEKLFTSLQHRAFRGEL